MDSLFKQVSKEKQLKIPNSYASKDKPDNFTLWQQDPSEENLSKLMSDLKPTISSALNTFTGGDKSLTTRAYILAQQSLSSYDPAKGTNIKTHVFNNLKRLNRVKEERSSVIHVPEGVRLDNRNIYKFKTEFMDRNDREPTLSELADGTGLSIKRISKAVSISEMPEGAAVSEKGDLLGSMHNRTKEDIWQDYVYYDLDPKNKKIFEWTTGYMGAKLLPKAEIAKKLKISPAAVSQRVGTIVKRLEEVNE